MKITDSKIFGEIIKKYMKARGLTQIKLSAMSKSAIYWQIRKEQTNN